MKNSIAATTSVLVLLLAGCGGTEATSLHSRQTSVTLADRNYEFVMHGVTGEACRSVFLGFGVDDTSYASAIEKIHKQVPSRYGQEYQLVNVVEDTTFEFYLFVWKNCTVLSADVLVLKEAVPPMGVQSRPRGEAPKAPASSEAAADLPVGVEKKREQEQEEKATGGNPYSR